MNTEIDGISRLNMQDFQADLAYKKGMEDGIRMGKLIAVKMLEEFISDKRKMFGLIGHKEEFINCFKRYMEE